MQVNGTLQIDFFKFGVRNTSATIIHIVDQASRFLVARVVTGETAAEAIRALERGWIRQFGSPKRIIVDEGRAFASQ